MKPVIPPRAVIYTKDVMNITGLKQRAAGRLLSAIRRQHQKRHGAFITTREFSQYTGISEDTIQPYLR